MRLYGTDLPYFCRPAHVTITSSIRNALAIAAVLLVSPALACDVRLRHAVPSCPAVTTSPEGCQGDLVGKAGDRQTVPATIQLMSSGHAYYCASHKGCVPFELVSINQCILTYIPRQKDETSEYLGHIVVDVRQAKQP